MRTFRSIAGIVVMIATPCVGALAETLAVEISSASETPSGKIFVSQKVSSGQLQFSWKAEKRGRNFKVIVDDDPGFRRPLGEWITSDTTLILNIVQTGLTPGSRYYVRVDPLGWTQTFTPQPAKFLSVPGGVGYVRRAWEVAGREWMGKYSGIVWNHETKRWKLDPNWPYRMDLVAPKAYYLEYAARPAIQYALVTHDLDLINELASFYLMYLVRFEPLASMRVRGRRAGHDVSLLENQGDEWALSLPWIESTRWKGTRIRECQLCNTQFFHPVARLIRLITLLPPAERTPKMKQFVSLYLPLVIKDHLIRLLFVTRWDYWGARDMPEQLVGKWKHILASDHVPRLAHQHAMFDWDLWLVATVAEMLGAHENDPALVSISDENLERLQEAVRTGVELFRTKETRYPKTTNWAGVTVGSSSYFNGTFDQHVASEYSGYSGYAFPALKNEKRRLGASWDISHSYRIPVFFRALYENRSATRVDFPAQRELQMIANQYVYKTFQGSLRKPLFNNYLDGGNGWYRVGYHGSDFGYPPAEVCDNRAGSKRPCLYGAVYGWGLLAFMNTDLLHLQQALVSLSLRSEPDLKMFRTKHYALEGVKFEMFDDNNEIKYPFLLFVILGSVTEAIQP